MLVILLKTTGIVSNIPRKQPLCRILLYELKAKQKQNILLWLSMIE